MQEASQDGARPIQEDEEDKDALQLDSQLFLMVREAVPDEGKQKGGKETAEDGRATEEKSAGVKEHAGVGIGILP